MKKLTLIILAIIAMNCLTFQKANAQCIEKGKMLIDVYYGYPNLFTQTLKSGYDNTIKEDVKISGIGPFGAKYEYLLSNKVGIALNINYANSIVKGKGEDYNGIVYDYKVSVPRFRIFPLFNFHFATTDQLDPYFLIGGGYGSFKMNLTSDDPDFEEESISGLGNVAFRVGIGTRYFFTDKFGANLELGLGGGGLLQFGVTGKF